MNDRQHLLLAGAAALGVLTLGGALLVWPRYLAMSEIRTETAKLQGKIEDLSGLSSEVERLARELEDARRIVLTDLKSIPEAPDVARIMHRLSLPADGSTVLNQEFTAGSMVEISAGESGGARAIPLTVDMRATFDAVYALIRSAEQLDDLVRVSSIRLAADRAGVEAESPMLLATVGLEVLGELPPAQPGVEASR
jgi:hypothetical protein